MLNFSSTVRHAGMVLTAAGFLLATAALHAAGLAIGTVSQRHSQWLARACGLGALATGLIYSFA